MSEETLGPMGQDEVSFKYVELEVMVRHLCMETTSQQADENC